MYNQPRWFSVQGYSLCCLTVSQLKGLIIGKNYRTPKLSGSLSLSVCKRVHKGINSEGCGTVPPHPRNQNKTSNTNKHTTQPSLHFQQSTTFSSLAQGEHIQSYTHKVEKITGGLVHITAVTHVYCVIIMNLP